MPRLSEGAKLSQIYTNHSIRATGATILTKSMFNPSQLMAVTGHKSVQSLTVHQRTDIEEKIAMGHAMGKSLTPKILPYWHCRHLKIKFACIAAT
jgi:hypothetical protein